MFALKILGGPQTRFVVCAGKPCLTLVCVKISRANTAKEQSSRPPSSPAAALQFRPHRHSFSLTQKQSSYDDCNFINRILFYDIY